MKTKDQDDEDTKLLRDGERLRVSLTMMDSVQKSVYADALSHHPSLSKPGYRFVTDNDAKQRIDDAHAEYRERISNAWRTSDQGEGDSCTAPDGTPGRLQFVAGKLKCVPEAAAKTSDNFGVNDDADLRELAYALYDADVRSRWKGEE